MKTVLKKLAFVITAASLATLITLTGCNQTPSAISKNDAVEIVNTLIYVKDTRTGICYAMVASRHPFDTDQNGFTITYVPCTPEVEKLIAQ